MPAESFRVLAALTLAALTVPAATGLAGIRYDAPTPDFAIRTARGTEHLASLRGRVVVIDFWATWCHVCTAEMKYFVRVQQTFGDRVAVVTVSDELQDVAASYFRLWNIDLTLVEDLGGAVFRSYSISKIPVTVVLDPGGNLSYVSVGGLSWDELQEAIERASERDSARREATPSTPAPGVLP